MEAGRPDNLARYSQADVVAHYASAEGLQPCERYVFDRYLNPGAAILDLGVGGGRTTPFLSSLGGRYVGADYSQAMVMVCRSKWPQLDFRWCDATEMGEFSQNEFDAVIFSFNGIDSIGTVEARQRCFSEVARVLRPRGLFVFSSHNARQLGVWPQLEGAKAYQIAWRVVRSVGKSVAIAARCIMTGAFREGQGYILDPVHGGLRTFVSTPATLGPELHKAGFDLLETVHGHYPTVKSSYLAPWYYYVCRSHG